VGRGTTVTLYLPKSTASIDRPQDHTGPETVETRPLRVLLVEDNPHVADVAGMLLAEHGHSITHAGTADEALGRLHAGQPFDLVFSDLVMPGEVDGLNLARRIRMKWPNLAVLLATGYSKAAEQATVEGFTLLVKPYQPEVLMAAIRQVTAETGASDPASSNVIPLARPSA